MAQIIAKSWPKSSPNHGQIIVHGNAMAMLWQCGRGERVESSKSRQNTSRSPSPVHTASHFH